MQAAHDMVVDGADRFLVAIGVGVVSDWFAAVVASVELVGAGDVERTRMVLHARPKKPSERDDSDAG